MARKKQLGLLPFLALPAFWGAVAAIGGGLIVSYQIRKSQQGARFNPPVLPSDQYPKPFDWTPVLMVGGAIGVGYLLTRK